LGADRRERLVELGPAAAGEDDARPVVGEREGGLQADALLAPVISAVRPAWSGIAAGVQ
jgi:hypothetical protein